MIGKRLIAILFYFFPVYMERVENLQCDGQTQHQKQCTKNGTIYTENGAHFLCWTHWKIWYKQRHKHDPPDPWDLLELPVDTTQMTSSCVNTLRSTLRNDFPSLQCTSSKYVGYIYVFHMPLSDVVGEPMFKIGYTTRKNVKKRIAEWPGAVLLHHWESSHASYAETIILLLLQHWRCYRFVLYKACAAPDAQKRYVSTWYEHPTRPVHDAVWASPQCPDWLPQRIYDVIRNDRVPKEITASAQQYTERYAYEQEWFYCPLDYVVQICTAVVEMIEHNKSDWHKGFQ